MQAYQTACAGVIDRFAGHIAQYLGDGLLVYFGYPVAHEDDVQRAVRTGLEIVQTLHDLNKQLSHPLQVRIGIHTGPVVVGSIGGGRRQEQLALGEVPNIAARVQALAEPDTVVLSAVTHRLVAGLFECQDLGPQTLKGISMPLAMYQVVRESEAQSRFEVAVGAGLTPLVGRDLEVGLLRERWAQAKGGDGQVVLLSGEAGIGKSRLVQTLKEQVMAEGATRIEFRCSPYHQNSAFYPIIDHLQRLLQFHREESPSAKLEKLQQALARYRFPQADTVSLIAALLSLPQPENAPPLTLSPQKQIAQIRQGLAAYRAAGSDLWQSHFLAMLAEAYGKTGQVAEGLAAVAEALDWAQRTGGCYYEAELYRLKGELTLQQVQVSSSKFQVPPNTQHPIPSTQAEACFLKAIEMRAKQQAKSLELRAAMSLSRLWQRQGKKAEARQMLADIYGWFTEGFDTKDLQEAKTLLEELSH